MFPAKKNVGSASCLVPDVREWNHSDSTDSRLKLPSIVRTLDKILKCALCKKDPKNPRVSECGHVMWVSPTVANCDGDSFHPQLLQMST